jgi:uncharacterized membrane protein
MSDLTSFAVIAGMAAVTYATRAGGLWLMHRTTPSAPLRAWLGHLPGTILISIIAPLALFGGIVTMIGAAVTMLVMLRTRQYIVAAAAGVLVVWALRTWM